MPRNSSGVFTLPIGAFAPSGLIKSSDHNSNYSDIATALTQSLATTGVSTMTGAIKAAAGAINAPSYTFGSNLTTGFWLAGANQIGWTANGVQGATFNSDLSVTWAGAATWAGNVTYSGTVTINGVATHGGASTFTGVCTFAAIPVFSAGLGNTSIAGTLSVSGKASFTSTDSMAVANGTTAQRNGAPASGDFRYNSTLNCFEGWNGSSWVQLGRSPTVQTFTTGTALTYTPSAGMVRIKVRMCAGGGGGAAGVTNSGSNGTDTSFGTWTAIHGGGGAPANGAGGTGGTGGVNGTGTLVGRFAGANGITGTSGTSSNSTGASGGSNPFGGAGGTTTVAGLAGQTNTGAGGGGGFASGNGVGGGGGAGEYVEFWMTAAQVGASQTYTVGGGGNGGLAGGNAGGNGAAGVIIIEEFYG